MNDFDAFRTGKGTSEWAEVNENIVRGCPNGCLYCYAAHNAARFKLKNRTEWQTEEFTKRSRMTSYPARDGIIMFPSAHDITPFSVNTYLRVAKLILEAGNRLLIVSKPRLDCIKKVCAGLAEHKDNILFRFTIGTFDDATSSLWEPGAPKPSERLDALRHAYEAGFSTSVSAEPLLGGLDTAKTILEKTRLFVSGTVWIGKLNKPRTRIVVDNERTRDAISHIERLQDDDSILAMFDELRNDPNVRWKDSVREVVLRERPSEII